MRDIVALVKAASHSIEVIKMIGGVYVTIKIINIYLRLTKPGGNNSTAHTPHIKPERFYNSSEYNMRGFTTFFSFRLSSGLGFVGS